MSWYFVFVFPKGLVAGGRGGEGGGEGGDVYSGFEGSTSTVLENYPHMN